MAQQRFRASVWNDENAPATDRGAVALDLVHQAADVFRNMEQHARETEARAQSLCTSAIEKVLHAEMRAEAAERAQRTLMIDAEGKLRDASRALEEAQSRLQAEGDRLTAMEFCAQAAKAEAREAKQALALVEEAIRRRLLCASSKVDSRLTSVA